MSRLPLVIFESQSASTTGQCDCDCDCACTPSVSSRLHSLVSDKATIDALQMTPHITLPLDDVHSICFGPYSSPTVVDRNAQSILEAFHRRDNLSIYARLCQEYGEKEAEHLIDQLIDARLLTAAENSLPNLQSNTLTIWLHVTDRCNLRCNYCYLPHDASDMSVEVGKECIRLAIASAIRHGYSKIKIKYAGGEPLLRFENIKQWHLWASALASMYGLSLNEVILSNGTLLSRQRAHEMKKLNIDLMISLDGLGSVHDSQRPYKSGRGSFQDAVCAIAVAQQAGLSPHISITVGHHNAQRLPELVKWLRDHNLWFNINFARSNKYYNSSDDPESLISSALRTFATIRENPPEHSILAGLVDRANLATPHVRTCAVESDYVVFDTLGRVHRCQMEIFPTTALDVRQDPISAIRDSDSPLNISVEQKGNCSTCEWKYWCTGGCPLIAEGGKIPYCSVYKTLIPEVFRLEGFRLLHHYQKGLQN